MLEATSQASLYIAPVLLTAYVLLWTTRMNAALDKKSVRLILLLISVPLSLIKIGHVGITSLVLSINPGFSVVSMGFLAILVVSELRGKPVMRQTDWMSFFGFNIVFGGYLYLSVLGLAPYDAYQAGYGFSWIFILTAVYTLLLVLKKNPVALFYVLAMAAWDYRLLAHSRNFYDYLIDGPLFIVSIIGLVVIVVRKGRNRQSG